MNVTTKNPTPRDTRTLVISERGFATSVQAATFLGITRQGVSKLIREGTIPAKRMAAVCGFRGNG